MSLAPPPASGDASVPTLNYAVRPPGPRRFAVGEIVAWIVIFGVVGFIAVRASREQYRQAASSDPDSTLQMRAQYVVGMHRMMGGAQPGQLEDQALTELDKNAKAAEDQLRVAVVAGEFRGTEEAIKRLDAIADAPPEVVKDIATAKALYQGGGGQGEAVPEATRAAFHDKYRWFDDLLESHGKPDTDPLRGAMLHRAMVTVGVLLGGFGVAGLLGVAGLVLLILAIVFLARRKITFAFSRDEIPGTPADRRTYAYGMAVYLGGYLGLGLGLRLLFHWYHVTNSNVAMAASYASLGTAFMVGLLLPLMRGQSVAQWREALGLHACCGALREMGCGLVVYLAGLPLLAIGMLVFMLLSSVSGLRGSHPVNEELGGSPMQLVMVFLLACVFAPITEELMFRGALFAHLRERFPWWFSAVMMGVIFALMHPQSWVALPVLATIGVTFGAIREWRGSIIGSMTAHALHNGMALLVGSLLMR